MGVRGAGRRHRLVVDRLEGELAAVEVDGSAVFDLPRWLLPPGAREGDVLWVRVEGGAEGWRVELAVDPEATRQAREAAQGALARLRKRDPGGDIEL